MPAKVLWLNIQANLDGVRISSAANEMSLSQSREPIELGSLEDKMKVPIGGLPEGGLTFSGGVETGQGPAPGFQLMRRLPRSLSRQDKYPPHAASPAKYPGRESRS